jgi:hypothetical protein
VSLHYKEKHVNNVYRSNHCLVCESDDTQTPTRRSHMRSKCWISYLRNRWDTQQAPSAQWLINVRTCIRNWDLRLVFVLIVNRLLRRHQWKESNTDVHCTLSRIFREGSITFCRPAAIFPDWNYPLKRGEVLNYNVKLGQNDTVSNEGRQSQTDKTTSMEFKCCCLSLLRVMHNEQLTEVLSHI